MLANRQSALDWVFFDEGGFIVRMNEPGGAGNLGIGFATFKAWETLNGNPHATLDDLKNMGKDVAGRIYETEWMKPLRFDELPSGIDYALFDASVNLGLSGAIKMLQEKVLYLPPDPLTGYSGHMDVITMAALMDLAKTRDVAVMITDAWLGTKRQSPEWHEFGKGWANRANKVKGRLLLLIIA